MICASHYYNFPATLLALLIPNTTANHAVTYTNHMSGNFDLFEYLTVLAIPTKDNAILNNIIRQCSSFLLILFLVCACV